MTGERAGRLSEIIKRRERHLFNPERMSEWRMLVSRFLYYSTVIQRRIRHLPDALQYQEM